jgi:dTDP-4-amino-4,6-dideoxygalactose transaminase
MTGSTKALPPIQPLDLEAERAELGDALPQAVLRVLASGRYVLGPEVEALERDFAALHGVAHGVAVATGTDALVLALLALGVERGQGVVTSPFTFFASAGAIAWIGARPLLADVDPETALLDLDAAGAAIDARTSALLPVHLYGQMVDVRAFRALAGAEGLALLEDAAQAHGASRERVRAGELGDAGAFSFYPTKNLGAAGEGGMILTRREDVARAARMLRDHGSRVKYRHERVGTNSRLHALQAAVLNVKLPRLMQWNERRRAIAARYDAAFAGSEEVRPLATAPGAVHARHQYTVRIKGRASRDAVLAGLAERGIHAAVHYPLPVHLQEAAGSWGYRPGAFPNAEALAREVLCLPVHPFLDEGAVERVAEALLALARGA